MIDTYENMFLMKDADKVVKYFKLVRQVKEKANDLSHVAIDREVKVATRLHEKNKCH